MKSNRDIRLEYSGKGAGDIILPLVRPRFLKAVRSFGQTSLLDRTDNKLIFGDNLLCLQVLLSDPEISRKVRLIYIDPPFSTEQEYKSGNQRTSTVSCSGQDETAYEDKLVGGDYLEFLRKRLVLLREILAEDGSIYVHIDCKIGYYVKVLMDEIFGHGRLINDITRIKCNPKNFARKGYGNIKDMILFYSKTDHYVWNEPRVEMIPEDMKRLFPKVDENGRRYTTVPLHAPGETRTGPTGRPWKGQKPPRGRHWRCSPEELNRLDDEGLIERSSSGNPRKRIYADESVKKGKRRQDIWEFKDPPYPSYPTEKNLNMLKAILQASSNPGDLVLDCFAGSGTTLLAAEELGRRWIGIDDSILAIEAAVNRLTNMKDISAFTLFEGQVHAPEAVASR
jgi:adenine-specific DNA-methyltransferase